MKAHEIACRLAGWTINEEGEFTDGIETLGSIGPTDPDGGWPTLCDAMGYIPAPPALVAEVNAFLAPA